MPSSTISKRLFVFDFDWTLIEADSDLWVAENLALDLAEQQKEFFGKILWTELQDLLLQRLFERGITQQDLERTLREIPLAPEIIAALRLMKSQGAELCIISDANTFYIEYILKAHGLDGVFSKIITNPAHFDAQGRLHVARFHGLDKEPHNCPLPCQPNLCKGQELQKLIDSQAWDQVIYMGDSTNDFCPSTRLQSRDIVLARADLLLEKQIKLHLDMVKAQVIYWQSPADVLSISQTLLNVPASAAAVVIGSSKPVAVTVPSDVPVSV
ncbi:putative phosphatase phospho1 [Mortierella sp. 14UC]|nr:putative phosphatase phospho1 [Mortierella sp. 14UC]